MTTLRPGRAVESGVGDHSQKRSGQLLQRQRRAAAATSSAGTTIGKLDFSSHTFGVGEVNIGGADLATVLSRKCAAN